MVNRTESQQAFFTNPLEFLFFVLIGVSSLVLLASPYYPFALLPGILVVLLLVLARKPQAGFLLLIFLFPFREFTALYELPWIGTVSPQKVIGFWLFIVLFFSFLLKKKDLAELRSGLWPWLVLFLIVNIFAAFLSPYKITALASTIKLLTPYLLFTLGLAFLDRQGFLRSLPAAFVSSVAIILMITFVITFTGTENPLSSFLEVGPKAFSLILVFCIPFLAHWFFSTEGALKKLGIFLLFAFILTGVVYTYSRAGGLLLLIVLFVLAGRYLRKFRPVYLGIVGVVTIAVLVAVIVFVPASYWARQKSITHTDTEESILARRSYLVVGWQAFQEHPIIGSGPGTFKDIYKKTGYAHERMRRMGRAAGLERHAHNTYLEVLVGSGLLGLSFFLLIIGTALTQFSRAKRQFLSRGDIRSADLTGAYQLSFIAILVYYFFISDLYHHYLWISLALSQVAARLSQEPPEPRFGPPAL